MFLLSTITMVSQVALHEHRERRRRKEKVEYLYASTAGGKAVNRSNKDSTTAESSGDMCYGSE